MVLNKIFFIRVFFFACLYFLCLPLLYSADEPAVNGPPDLAELSSVPVGRTPEDPPAVKEKTRLMAALADPAPSVRAEAVYALGTAGNFTAVKILKKTALDPDEITAINSIWALGEIKDASTVEFLYSLFQAGNETIKINVIIALGKIKTQAAVEIIEKIGTAAETETVKLLAEEVLENGVYIDEHEKDRP